MGGIPQWHKPWHGCSPPKIFVLTPTPRCGIAHVRHDSRGLRNMLKIGAPGDTFASMYARVFKRATMLRKAGLGNSFTTNGSEVCVPFQVPSTDPASRQLRGREDARASSARIRGGGGGQPQ